MNTHFFTLDPGECGAVRRAGACRAKTTTVHRLYNNRDNHRFVVRTALRDQMVAEGWTDEGIAMCLIDYP